MMDPHIYDFSAYQQILLIICAISVGISKTALPGFGIFVVPLIAIAMPGQTLLSTGLLLGLLILADLFAAAYYRRHAQWNHIRGLLPWALAGIVAGYLLMGRISNDALRPIIAILVFTMLAWGLLRKKVEQTEDNDNTVRHGRLYVGLMGFAAGFTTMLANAAGPVMTTYLLASGLPKNAFVGTSAWFFFIVNWVKVPFQVSLGGINTYSVRTNLLLVPAIIVGGIIGMLLLRRLPQRVFNAVIAVLTAAAAARLLWAS